MHLDDRLALGADLTRLRNHLQLSTSDFGYLMGLKHWQYIALSRQHAHDILPDPALSLLVWSLFAFPQCSYLKPLPNDPQAAFTLYREAAQHLSHSPSPARLAHGLRAKKDIPLDTKRAFGLMLGSDISAGNRWLSGHTAMGAVVKRLLYILVRVCANEGEAGLRHWYHRVLVEAHWRGIDDLWVNKTWYGPSESNLPARQEGTHRGWRRMRIGDLKLILERYNLRKSDSAYLIGQVDQKIGQLRADGWEDVIKNPSLSLLFWALLEYPDYSYRIDRPPLAEIVESYQNAAAPLVDLPCQQFGITPRRKQVAAYRLDNVNSMALMVGSRRAYGRQWLSRGMTPRPFAAYLLLVLKNVCDQEGSAGLKRWFERVVFESRQRGVENLWSHGKWRPD